jgi:opacity protein-like surface antigen
MMERLKFLIPAFFISATVLFIHPNALANIRQGWEVGARTGLMWQSGTLNIAGTEGVDTLNSERYIADNGWVGGVFAGYNWKDAPVTFGLNLSLDWNEIDDPHNFHAIDSGGDNFLVRARYERDFFYGFSGRVGYQTSPTMMPYVRVGIERSTNRLRLKADDINNPDMPVRILDKALSHHKTGYLVGLGAEFPILNKNTHLRLEYQFHICGHLEFAFNQNGFVAKADYQPKAHFLTLALQWSQV